MGAGYYDVAQLLSDWVIVNAGTDAKVLVVVSEEITSTLSMENGIKDEFAKYAPDATVDFVNVAIVDWGSKCQSETENYLSAHPDTDYIISIYDSATQYIVPAVKSTGSSAKIVAYNGTPFAVDYVKTGDIEMLLGEDLQTIAYATVDFEMRTALDMPIVEEPTLLRMWTSENVDEALNADGKCEYGIGYGDSAKLAYEKLWGLS
jgi:ribose transport system substrate-binding protein